MVCQPDRDNTSGDVHLSPSSFPRSRFSQVADVDSSLLLAGPQSSRYAVVRGGRPICGELAPRMKGRIHPMQMREGPLGERRHRALRDDTDDHVACFVQRNAEKTAQHIGQHENTRDNSCATGLPNSRCTSARTESAKCAPLPPPCTYNCRYLNEHPSGISGAKARKRPRRRGT